MIKKIIILTFLFICNVDFVVAKEVKPEWIEKPFVLCKNNEFCAVGSGDSMGVSFSNAREEVAKQLSVEVLSNYTNYVSRNNDDIKLSENNSVKEFSNELLKGIKIKETFNDNFQIKYFADNIYYGKFLCLVIILLSLYTILCLDKSFLVILLMIRNYFLFRN